MQSTPGPRPAHRSRTTSRTVFRHAPMVWALALALPLAGPAPAAQAQVPPALPATTDRWMGEYGDVIGQRLLTQVAIPGTHDSATSQLDIPAPYLADANNYARINQLLTGNVLDVLTAIGVTDPFAQGLLTPLFFVLQGAIQTTFGAIVSEWSIAQNRTLLEQLLDGVRYFDLRYCWDHVAMEIRACHGAFGASMEATLAEIAAFVDAPGRDREIIVIDLRTPVMSNEQKRDVLAAIDAKLGHRLVAAARVGQLATLTINDLWRDDRQIIVLYDETPCGPGSCPQFSWRPWPKAVMDAPWNSVRTATGIKSIPESDLANPGVIRERMTLALEHRDQTKMLVLGTALTPSQEYITNSALSCRLDPLEVFTSREACSLFELGMGDETRVDLAAAWWIDNENLARTNMNIISVDAYQHTGVVPSAIAMNIGPVITVGFTAGGAPYTLGNWAREVDITLHCATQPAFPETLALITGTSLQIGTGERRTFSGPSGSLTVLGSLTQAIAFATCVDEYGKHALLTVAGLDIRIDRTPPVIAPVGRTPPANQQGWNNTDVEVGWTCSDEHSGPVAAQVSATVSAEGANEAVTGTCRDRAGNTASHSATGINIDKTGPTIAFESRTAANAAGWNNTDVALTWRCADALSGAVSATVAQTVTSEGQSQSATATCTDRAGNQVSDTRSGVNIDRTHPIVTASAITADGRPYAPGTWTNQDVTVAFTCIDALSGVREVTPPVTIGAEGADQGAAGTCVDHADNGSGASFTDVDVDRTAPVTAATLDGPRSPFGWFTGRVVVTLTAGDALAGVAATQYRIDGGPVQLYTGPFAIAAAGRHTVSFASTDLVGNVETDRTIEFALQPYALFAARDACDDTSALKLSGGSIAVTGDVHSNGGLRVSGARHGVAGASSTRCAMALTGGQMTFTEGPTKVEAVADWPLAGTDADLACTVSREGTFDLSQDGPWWVGGTKSSEELVAGVYCATGADGLIKLSGSRVSGAVTLVAERIQLSGSNLALTAHQGGILALASGNGPSTLKVSGSGNDLVGVLVAPAGQIDLSGAGLTLRGSVLGSTLKLSGSGWTIDSSFLQP